MKKNILKAIKATVLSKKETQTIVGGYLGGSGNCYFRICGGEQNKGPQTGRTCSRGNGTFFALYVYKPDPSYECIDG